MPCTHPVPHGSIRSEFYSCLYHVHEVSYLSCHYELSVSFVLSDDFLTGRIHIVTCPVWSLKTDTSSFSAGAVDYKISTFGLFAVKTLLVCIEQAGRKPDGVAR